MISAATTVGRLRFIWLLVGTLSVTPCNAIDFRIGNVEGLFDVTVAYGLGIRLQDADKDLIGIANGGRRSSVNNDDGTLNYDTGVFSNALRVNADLTLAWRQFGAYIRGFAFYDYENQHEERERTRLSDGGKDIVGKDADLLDHYVSARFRPAGVPLLFRLGDQVVNWGETRFVRDGIDIINPFDFTFLAQPAMSVRDSLIPQGMLWGVANVTERVSVEGYYQYEWKAVRLPPVGSYFSTNDAFGGDGVNFFVLGEGRFSDLGTDLDAAFGLPPGTLGFDPNFQKLPGRGTDKPRDEGQYGLTVSAILPGTRATRIGAHVIRYHSRLPIFSGITADQAAVDATSQGQVDALAASLVPDYLSAGLSPTEAVGAASETAEALTTSRYLNQSGYFVEYPEDITAVGLSFSTSTVERGILVVGDIAHHFDFPFQISLQELFAAVRSPIQFDSTVGDSRLGRFGAGEVVKGFLERDRTQVSLGVTKLFGPRLGASQTALGGDLAMVYVHDMPGANDAQLQAVAPPSKDSWGYRVTGRMSYNSVLGGLNLVPRVLFTHDFHGVTPAPISTFVSGRKSLTLALGARYINRWTADLGYTRFFGGEGDNLLRDRDLFRFRVSYTF